ncbi:hypothetical protein Nepgr_021201 [Nepenthes gracilis]|uniref:Uncharacterized protein n=1 Tax=Nepenthes gracilis TaxID=150966 RepID=A0AAD3SY81_NEPGR|nr:hypothetical protein Nepgr_021201 [Nepenthes gracilis]
MKRLQHQSGDCVLAGDCQALMEIEETATATEDMELEQPQPAPNASGDLAAKALNGDSNLKRERGEQEVAEERDAIPKKQRIEKSVEEERLDNLKEREGGDEEKAEEQDEGEKSASVNVGPKSFRSSVEIFDYYFNFLHQWAANVNVNKYEHMALLDLIKKGHPEPDKKIGAGIHAFQVRYHPVWKSRCFFLIRSDGSVDDFSFRKCVDHILPLPEHMKIKPDVNKALGGGGRGHGSKGNARGKDGGGHGRGHTRGNARGGKFKN